MLKGFNIENYGLADIGVQFEIRKLVKIVDSEKFIKHIEEIISKPICDIEGYINNLRVKVILEYHKYINDILDIEIVFKLENFYSKINPNNIKKLKVKIIKFINDSFENIWESDEYRVKNITLDWILSFKGFKKWDFLVNNMGNMRNTCINRFESIYDILNKNYKDLAEIFVEKILIPVEIEYNIKEQIDIYSMINSKYINITNKFENKMMEYIEGLEFSNLHIYDRNDLLDYIIKSNAFSEENRIKIQILLKNLNKELKEEILKSGFSYGVKSDVYRSIEESMPLFRDKLYFLVSFIDKSCYSYMQDYESQEKSIMDILDFKNTKYDSLRFRINLNICEGYICVSTKYILEKYKDKFWSELKLLIEDVEKLTGISNFIWHDIETIKVLLQYKNYFIISSLLTQVIERLLRELYLKINHNVVGFFKSIENPTLGVLLDYERKDNILLRIFDLYEIEALNYFLCNKDKGKNLRNLLAHYQVDSSNIRETEFLCLLNILIFILIKIDYNGLVFD